MTIADAPSTGIPDVVRVSGLSKRFVVRKDNSLKERIVTLGKLGRRHREDFWALRDIDLSISAGTTIGLIGHNGSGKSTLLKLIGGILDPSDGTIESRGRIAALLELGAGFHPDLTGRENVYLNAAILGLSRAVTESRFDDILAFAGIGEFIDSQVKFYSSGMYVRLAFAVAVHTDPDILLVDEVLAVGDEAFQRKCLDKIRSFQQEGRTIILVSHSLGQVAELCDRVVLLNRGAIVVDGDPHEAVARFRDLLEERRQAETPQDAPAAPQVAITAVGVSAGGVSVSGQGDRAAGELMPGDRLVITMDVDATESIDDLVAAVQIDNTSGQVVYGTTTRRMGVTIPPFTGSMRISVTLDDVRLGPGKYFVNASLMDGAGIHLHDRPQAASFNAHDYQVAVGTLYAKPTFEFDRD